MSYRYENLYIMHYGVGHDKGGHSGRYPWGSGKNPYGGVDPTTKKSDLFKLNGRKFNDVASDLIVKKKYGNRTDVSEEDVAKAKKRTQIALATGEAAIAALATGAVGATSINVIKKAQEYDDLVKTSEWFTKSYVDNQTDLLRQYHGIKNIKRTASDSDVIPVNMGKEYGKDILENYLHYNRHNANSAMSSVNNSFKNINDTGKVHKLDISNIDSNRKSLKDSYDVLSAFDSDKNFIWNNNVNNIRDYYKIVTDDFNSWNNGVREFDKAMSVTRDALWNEAKKR